VSKRTQHLVKTLASFALDSSRVIECAGQRFVADDDLAYVKFTLARSFPVVITDGTALHPQVVANSWHSLNGKVFNLCHLMKANFPNEEEKVQDRILGYIRAVEFPETPCDGWKLPTCLEHAPEITAVAAMFKAATGVRQILSTWAQGKTLFSNEPWTVSMENWSDPSEGGFLVRGESEALQPFVGSTPDDIRAAGYTYVPAMSAPLELMGCLNSAEDDAADGCTDLRVKRKFQGLETVFLIAGLTGGLRFSGTALTPFGKEPTASVKQMLASQPVVDLGDELNAMFAALNRFLNAREISENKSAEEKPPGIA
jgi:hypothetical protein